MVKALDSHARGRGFKSCLAQDKDYWWGKVTGAHLHKCAHSPGHCPLWLGNRLPEVVNLRPCIPQSAVMLDSALQVIMIRGVSEKFQDWGHKQFIAKNLYKLQVFFFKAISFESNALSHSVLPCLHALLEGFFWNMFQFRQVR